MDCAKLNELYTDYLDGALGDESRAKFEAHVSGCRRCQEDFALFQAVVAETHSLRDLEPVPVPMVLRANVRAAIEASAGPSWISRALEALRQPAYSLSFAGATLCAILVAVAVLRNPGPMMEAPTTSVEPRSQSAAPMARSRDGDMLAKQEQSDALQPSVMDAEVKPKSGRTDDTRRLPLPPRFVNGHTRTARPMSESLEAPAGPIAGGAMQSPAPTQSLGGQEGRGMAGGMMGGGGSGTAGGFATLRKVPLESSPTPGNNLSSAQRIAGERRGAQSPSASAALARKSVGKRDETMKEEEKMPAITDAAKPEQPERYGVLGDIARSKNQDRSAAAVAQAQSGEPKDTDLLMLQRNREDGGNLSYYYLAPVQPETNQNVNIRLGARVYQNQPNRELQQNRSRAQAQRSMHLPTLKAGVQTSTQIGEATTLFAELASETKLADVILTVDAPKSIEFLAGNRAAKGSVTIWSGSLLPQKVQRASTRIRASHNGPQQITLTLLRNREEIVAQQTFLFSVGQQISSPAASPAASKR